MLPKISYGTTLREAFHGELALSRRLVAVLGPVVRALVGTVLDQGHALAVGRTVGAELVGDDHPRHGAGLLEELAEEPPGRSGVPPVLHEDVKHVAVGVDGPPQVLPLPVDLDEDLVQVPFFAGPGWVRLRRRPLA